MGQRTGDYVSKINLVRLKEAYGSTQALNAVEWKSTLFRSHISWSEIPPFWSWIRSKIIVEFTPKYTVVVRITFLRVDSTKIYFERGFPLQNEVIPNNYDS